MTRPALRTGHTARFGAPFVNERGNFQGHRACTGDLTRDRDENVVCNRLLRLDVLVVLEKGHARNLIPIRPSAAINVVFSERVDTRDLRS
jgi:hypothetical protein